MLDEQAKIFEKLPDGAIIHRQIPRDNKPSNNVSASEGIELVISYFNESFFAIFETLVTQQKMSSSKLDPASQ